MSETHSIQNLERTHLTFERGQTYIALEDYEFRWSLEQVQQVEEMWSEGRALHTIANTFDRTCLETALLIMDRAEKGFIGRRINGIF